MPTWHKDESNHRGHVKFRKAGFWSALIVEHCWRLALQYAPETAEITQFWEADYFADELRWPPELQHEIAPAMAKAIEVRLIDMVDGRVYVHDWHDWQEIGRFPQRGRTTAERMRDHRARKRGDAPLPQPDLPGLACDTPTPPREQSRAEQSRAEQIGDVTGDVTGDGACHKPVTDTAHAQRFCIFFDELAGKNGHPTGHHTPSDVSRTEIAFKQLCDGHPSRALEMAQEVARWAFERSETWKDGGHWREVLTSPTKFWDKWVSLVQQFNRKPAPVRGEPVHRVKGPKLTAKIARRLD